jgi:hypothetical protein
MKDNIKMDLKNLIHLAQVPVNMVMCLRPLPPQRQGISSQAEQATNNLSRRILLHGEFVMVLILLWLR